MWRAAALAAGLLAGPVQASDGLPFDVGGPFTLTDQFGEARTEASFGETPVLLFFGYATCRGICSVALPRMAQTVDLLDAAGIEVTPVLITVDPEHDTPAALREAAPAIHPRLIALTGDAKALAAARKAYRVELERVGEDIEGPIYRHGSLVYLLDPTGEALSILPPILGPERMAEIAQARLEVRD